MEKIDRLLDAIEHPEDFAPDELDSLLRDPEVKEAFDLLDKTKSSLYPIGNPNVDAEWKRFEQNHRQYRSPSRFRLTAAASIAIGIVSFSAVAAIVGLGINNLNSSAESASSKPVETKTGSVSPQNDVIKTDDEANGITPEIVVFDNETLEAIISRIATCYGCSVFYCDDAPRSLRLYFRWDRSLTIGDVIERLNRFEQIRITLKDNTIIVG